MTSPVERLFKGMREALAFTRILNKIGMEDAAGHTTVVVTKRGKVVGTVHGQRPARKPTKAKKRISHNDPPH